MATQRRSLLGSPTVQTLGIFLAVFLAQTVLISLFRPLLGLFVLDKPFSEPWTLVTSVYSHAGIAHLASNSIALALFGIPLERSTTTWAYHVYFVTTGAIAGAVQVLFPQVVGAVLGVIDTITLGLLPISGSVDPTGVIGASGAVFAVLGYLITGNRLSQGLLDSVDEWVQVGIGVAIALAVTWLTASPGVALIAHFTGLLLGLMAGAAGVLPSRKGQSASYNSTPR